MTKMKQEMKIAENNEDDPDKLEQPSFLDDVNEEDKENQGERSSSQAFSNTNVYSLSYSVHKESST